MIAGIIAALVAGVTTATITYLGRQVDVVTTAWISGDFDIPIELRDVHFVFLKVTFSSM